MFRSSLASRFWRVGEGLVVANVEAVGTKGVIFTHNFARLRVTSSNMAHGQVYTPSLERLEQWQRDWISDAMKQKRSIQVGFETHLLSAPWRGEIADEMFITKVMTKIID